MVIIGYNQLLVVTASCCQSNANCCWVLPWSPQQHVQYLLLAPLLSALGAPCSGTPIGIWGMQQEGVR